MAVKENESSRNYELIRTDSDTPIKAWVKGVQLEDAARKQLVNASQLPFIHKWIAAMPDVHYGIGATVGSVIPTKGAIIPAAVGVDIGCGMMAVETSLTARASGQSEGSFEQPLKKQFHTAAQIKASQAIVEHGIDSRIAFRMFGPIFTRAISNSGEAPGASSSNNVNHLGTLGTGNHFIEVCLDEKDTVWFMLHSGSRGVGNRIGSYFIELAREDMRRLQVNLPDKDLAYFPEGTKYFDDYVEAVGVGAGVCARKSPDHDGQRNRGCPALRRSCHHSPLICKRSTAITTTSSRNDIMARMCTSLAKGQCEPDEANWESFRGAWARDPISCAGWAIPESFESCSHGAGRAMSRGEAKRRFSVQDHARMTEGIECRKDADVIDETPAAYKPIDAVMAAQKDLVEVVHELRQVVVVKG